MEYVIRELTEDDLVDGSGFFETLSNLSEIGDITFPRRKEIFHKIIQNSIVFVAEKPGKGIVATVKLMVEPKLCHNGDNAGHIEDVVTLPEYEGQGISTKLIAEALRSAKELKCYKVILDCSNELIPFYKKNGFYEFEICMRTNL